MTSVFEFRVRACRSMSWWISEVSDGRRWAERAELLVIVRNLLILPESTVACTVVWIEDSDVSFKFRFERSDEGKILVR